MGAKISKKGKRIINFFTIFLILLLLQVPLIALFKYKLALFPDAVWLWKEILILLILIWDLYLIYKNPSLLKDILKSLHIKITIFGTILLGTIGLIMALIQPSGLLGYVLFVKYDLFYLILFLSITIGVYGIAKQDTNVFQDLYNFLLIFSKKWLLILIILSFLWYIVIFLKPTLLTHIGYQKNLLNSAITLSQPIAAQKTEILYGFVRNQFLFELPLGWAFFLTAFFPIYFVSTLKKLKLQKTIISWGIWLVAISITFSRAAIATFLLESLVLFGIFFVSKKSFKKLIIGGALFILILAPFIYKGYIARSGSNTGHFIFTYETWNLIKAQPLFGRGPGTSGAASHHLCKFKPDLHLCNKIKEINKKGGSEFLTGLNPENHYLQIRMELGIIGLLIWIIIHFNLLYPILYLKTKGTHIQKLLGARSLGLAALLLQSLVLHPFNERIITYIFMSIGGIIRGLYIVQTAKDSSKANG